MALLHSTAQRNGTLAGVGPVMSAYNGGSLRIFGGTAPTSADAVEPSAPLAVVPMPATLFPAPIGGLLTANTIPPQAATAAGTATWARLVTSADTGVAVTTTQPRIQGSVSVTGGGGDFQLSTTAIVVSALVSVTSLTYQHPN